VQYVIWSWEICRDRLADTTPPTSHTQTTHTHKEAHRQADSQKKNRDNTQKVQSPEKGGVGGWVGGWGERERQRERQRDREREGERECVCVSTECRACFDVCEALAAQLLCFTVVCTRDAPGFSYQNSNPRTLNPKP
jgi:hypothetical protein